MKNGYFIIAGRIRRELKSIATVVKRTIRIWKKGAIIGDDMYIDASALNLHSFYSGIEKIFVIIAEGIDLYKPSSASWHKALIQQMGSEIKSVRPPVISDDLINRLDSYRGFRHVVRNVYTYNLDEKHIKIMVDDLEDIMNALTKELSAFADFLEKIET
ncbi:hypothetical protein MHK_002357 [Candidatus Magnetomorum sp. HK-1]|nr:hypothetical protein MHK_002357 [Candidatus Magnetomorum sp. HK-1]